MVEPQKQRVELMYTPVCHIPIGEPIKTPDGRHALKFKKAGSKETEVVPIDTLITMMVTATEKCK